MSNSADKTNRMQVGAIAAASQVLAQVSALKATDRRVRSHEQAHLAASGGYAKGGASYRYSAGPDGQMYAVAGEVSIDTSPVEGDPEATIRKMQVVKAAAYAPMDPSSQDRAVAARAAAVEAQAQQQLASGDTSPGSIFSLLG